MVVEFEENPHISNMLKPKDGVICALNAIFDELNAKEVSILFLLSGGSSIDILNKIDTDLITNRVTLCTLDERYSLDPNINNMDQIMQTSFFKKARENGANVIDTRVLGGESQEALAERFNSALKNWIVDNPDGKIIATVGIGPDGHVSGIMPFPEDAQKFHELFDDGDPSHLVVGYDATGKNEFALRVTTTFNLLRKIDAAVCYVVGESKRDAVYKLRADEGSIEETPARILKEIPGKVFLFTDQ